MAARRSQLLRLYKDLDQELAESRGRCQQSGNCCRYSEFGHTLFLSKIEAELLFQEPSQQNLPPTADGCPYQIGGRCTARDRRPLGCRFFFCNPEFQAEMPLLAERWTNRLKRLHEELQEDWDYRPLHQFTPDFWPGTPIAGKCGELPVLDSSHCGK
jgi:hypothetical protein